MTADPIQDLSGLRWIRRELDENLRQTRLALEDFVEGDREDLNDAIKALHEVQGALSITGVYGGAMLGDELERLASAMNRGQIARKEAAAEVLMLGIAQLPAYLERIEQGQPDIPLVLLPLMNDLRAARDAPLVSETSLFAPKLNVQLASEPVVAGSGNPDLPELVRNQRVNYHRGLLKWLREMDVREGMVELRGVVDRISSVAGTQRLRHLLDAAEALLVALLDDTVENSVAVRLLFGRLDRVFKSIIDSGEESAVADFPLELLKNLLYYVARSDSTDPVVQAVRRSADLANSFPEISADELHSRDIGGAGRELFDAVADALEEDLSQIKDRLDLYMRGEPGDLQRLGGLVDPLRRMGDTLGMIGRGDLRTRLVPHSDVIQAALGEERTPEENDLVLLAGDLLAVESALPGLSESHNGGVAGGEGSEHEVASGLEMSNAEYRQHMQTVVDQASVDLARVKESLSVYLADTAHSHTLSEMPVKLHTVAGAFTIIRQPRVAAVVDGLSRYIDRLMGGEEEAPDQPKAEKLADLFSGIEYYLEYLFRPSPNHAKALNVAEQALHVLQGEGPETVDLTSPEGEETEKVAGVDEDIAQEPGSLLPEEVIVSQPAESADENAVEQAEGLAVAEVDIPDPQLAAVSAEEPGGEEEEAEELDSEILAIFVEEAREELEVIQEQYPLWRDDSAQEEALTRIRRSFHTLKGSGRLVGAMEIGEFAWSIEDLLNRVIDGTTQPGPELFQLLDETVELLPGLIDAREQGGPANPQTAPLQARALALANGEHMAEPAEVLSESTDEVDADSVGLPPSVLEESTLQVTESEGAPGAPTTGPGADMDVLAHSLMLDLEEATREEGAAGDPAESEITPQESILTSIPEAVVDEDSSTTDWTPSQVTPDESILTPISEEKPPIELSSALYDIFTQEAQEHLSVLRDFVERCRGQAGGCTYDEGLSRALHTLRGSADMAEVAPVATLAGVMEKWANLSASFEHRTDPIGIDLLERGHYVLNSLVSAINQPGADMPEWDGLTQEFGQQIVRLEHQNRDQEDAREQVVEDEAYDEELAGIFAEEARELIDSLEITFEQWRAHADDLLPVAEMQRSLHTMKGGARLASVAAIGDLSHATESLFESLADQRVSVSDEIQTLVRHTLDALAGQVEALERKTGPIRPHPELIVSLEGAARGERVTLTPAGAQVDVEPEGDATELAEEPEPEPESEPSAEIGDWVQSHDTIETADSALFSDSQLLTDSELLAGSDLATSSALVPGDGDLGSSLHEDARIIQFPARGRNGGEGEEKEPVRRAPPPEEDKSASKSKERVRVRASMLDQMVNNAGEVSIYRARLEQQNKTLGYNLEELSQTIGRLREQLRQLEIETEAQVLSRHEREHDGETPEGFDPLEMDRYSTIQQLSRALSETTEDLNNIGVTLQDLSRDTDTLLQQQSRIANDLQDSLLRTRMVPVGSRAARLQRVVRQTAQTLGKQAELKISGAQGEMDRAILERMMGPLEHLLRNAVAHGIEMPEERERVGKPGDGKISLKVDREGSEVILIVSDDGRGLDREAIRRQAEERGLIDPGATIDGKDLDAFILEAGLSTTDEVSQVSGRGVGMDVVVNEIKQLGGRLDITSEPGNGTSFTVRLPFTLAISEALLVGVGEEVYAVPHGSMDGIARIARSELEACYRGEKEGFSYGGIDYSVRYLGSMLGLGSAQLPDSERWLPVLLVRSGEHRIAIQVDNLLGNRQIVVKSVGPQLSSISWFSGGTILADGRLALILDMGALVRVATVHQSVSEPQVEEAPEPEGIKVMVVDDSITVRKVTSRLLERHNMQVITARDGVDAVALLQEERPDVMLLDIEMPRMDGFELARHMRSTDELKDIPIIMITSRTGNKHRLHAVDLGVRRYLGKPYQEADLLDNIYSVLAEGAE